MCLLEIWTWTHHSFDRSCLKPHSHSHSQKNLNKSKKARLSIDEKQCQRLYYAGGPVHLHFFSEKLMPPYGFYICITNFGPPLSRRIVRKHLSRIYRGRLTCQRDSDIVLSSKAKTHMTIIVEPADHCHSPPSTRRRAIAWSLTGQISQFAILFCNLLPQCFDRIHRTEAGL